jgi:hypothetical protein
MDEFIDFRYLGALRCVDRATGFHLTRRMRVVAEDASFLRNRSNLYVIKTANGLEQHNASFSQPPALPGFSLSVQVSDPLNQYLPRIIEVDLPRDAEPEHFENEESLFNPVRVRLYAAPNAKVMTNWSTVRVSVMRNEVNSASMPVAGALLRVIRNSDDVVLSSGLSDERGEVLIIVPGVPITQFADEEDDQDGGSGRGRGRGNTAEPPPVVVSELSARLEVSVDSDLGWPTNPDVLELNHTTNLVATELLTLRTGRMEKVSIQLT